jgi:TetR/AcrR family transcriptional repressor of multidrug resistance operon
VSPTVDRPAAIRRALRDLVAERGFHGASMGAVAREAGVATGTAYVHYDSKEELVYATYVELKHELGIAVLAEMDISAPPRERWDHLMRTVYAFLAEEPSRARFLTQLEESPFYEEARARLDDEGNALHDMADDPELAELLVDLPLDVINTLSFGAAVRLAAAGIQLKPEEVNQFVEATWRAITKS